MNVEALLVNISHRICSHICCLNVPPVSAAVCPLLLRALSPEDSIPSSLGKLWLSKFQNAACTFTFHLFLCHCFYSSGEIDARSRETILSLKSFPGAKPPLLGGIFRPSTSQTALHMDASASHHRRSRLLP